MYISGGLAGKWTQFPIQTKKLMQYLCNHQQPVEQLSAGQFIIITADTNEYLIYPSVVSKFKYANYENKNLRCNHMEFYDGIIHSFRLFANHHLSKSWSLYKCSRWAGF